MRKPFTLAGGVALWVLMGLAAAAETISISARDFTDVSAAKAGEDGLGIFESGTVVCAVRAEAAGPCTFVVVARGEEAGGEWPLMTIGVDGRSVLETRVQSDRWASYTFQQDLEAGPHVIAFTYPNDFFSEEADRNLHLLNLTIVTPAGVKPPALMNAADYGAVLADRRRAVLEEASARIAKVRAGRLAVRVLGAQGEPVAGARVGVGQKRHEFPFGVALSSDAFTGAMPEAEREQYFTWLSRYFNHAVPENALKWQNMEPKQAEVAYDVIDRMLDWCNMHGFTLRGHCVFWSCEPFVPEWARLLPDEKLRAAIGLRARVLAGRYRGRIDEFDVNNEMMHCSYLENRLGDGVRRQMFHEILAANPKARLYVNDYGVLEGDMLGRYAAHIRGLLGAGVPVGGIGVQAHFDGPVDPLRIGEALDALAVFRLPIKITEFDCATSNEQVQAETLETVYRMAFSHPAVEGILAWSFWDKACWKPQAGWLRADFSKKPAAETYQRLVFEEWWTDAEGQTDTNGSFVCDAFFGDFAVTAEGPEGQRASGTVHHARAAGISELVLRLAAPEAVREVREPAEDAEPVAAEADEPQEAEDDAPKQKQSPRRWLSWRKKSL